MKILVLAPQPFYQERGTPIAVRLLLETLSSKLGSCSGDGPQIDLLVYGEGQDIVVPGVRIVRSPAPRFLRGIRPGISLKKLACDIFFFAAALSMLWRARKEQYAVVHAVEEAVFIAWLAKKLFGTPYVYDMDSSLSMQLTEKWWLFRPLLPILGLLEGVAVRGSIAVAPVCDALLSIAERHGSPHTVMLRDVSLLPADGTAKGAQQPSVVFGEPVEDGRPIVLYVGNLERYQGIDLLLESFALLAAHPSRPQLVVIGGTPASIESYSRKASELGCLEHVAFLGPRPVSELKLYLGHADILVSPRIKGNNTPMKIYSYIHSGTALVATNLPTHSQVLSDKIAVLAAATPQGFAAGIQALLESPEQRSELGARAREQAEQLYTVAAFESQLLALYSRIRGSAAQASNDSVLQAESS